MRYTICLAPCIFQLQKVWDCVSNGTEAVKAYSGHASGYLNVKCFDHHISKMATFFLFSYSYVDTTYTLSQMCGVEATNQIR